MESEQAIGSLHRTWTKSLFNPEGGDACSESVNHNRVKVLNIPALLLEDISVETLWI